MSAETHDNRQPSDNDRFEFIIGLPNRTFAPTDFVAISEVQVRAGAKFLGFRDRQTVGGPDRGNVAISVAQTLEGPTVTWYLLIPDWTLSDDQVAAIRKIAVGFWQDYGCKPTFLFADVPTLRQAIALVPNPSGFRPRWATE